MMEPLAGREGSQAPPRNVFNIIDVEAVQSSGSSSSSSAGSNPRIEHAAAAAPGLSGGFSSGEGEAVPGHFISATTIKEVRVAISTLQFFGHVLKPPRSGNRYQGAGQQRGNRQERREGNFGGDVFDWLQEAFSFQEGNVKNQREHLVLLLANWQMTHGPLPPSQTTLDDDVIKQVSEKLLQNYVQYCQFLRIESSIMTEKSKHPPTSPLSLPGNSPAIFSICYAALFLLIWGEAANARFLPECLAYIFHHLAAEMNNLLLNEAGSYQPRSIPEGPFGFLTTVVQPIYDVIKAEVESSNGGKAPYWKWRNYDDFNEVFWHKTDLGWPMDRTKPFFALPGSGSTSEGKQGFVEQRSLLQLLRSFDRVWLLLVLLFQALTVIAWNAGDKPPWQEVTNQDTVATLLSVFVTWAAMSFCLALVDFVLSWRLLSRRRISILCRMTLKLLLGIFWLALMTGLYVSMWSKRDAAGSWNSAAAQNAFRTLLIAAAIFVSPHVIGVVMFLLPSVSRWVESTNVPIMRDIVSGLEEPSFVGRGMREGTWDSIKYTSFWLLLLAIKVTFTYQFQIHPLVEPTKSLWSLNVDYTWFQPYHTTNTIAVILLWLPVGLIYLMDIQIWYAILSSIVGYVVGIFSHIGEISNIKLLVRRFKYLPKAINFNLLPPMTSTKQKWRFWSRFKLQFGLLKASHQRGFQQKDEDGNEVVDHSRWATIWNEIILSFREEDLLTNREVNLLLIPDSKILHLSVEQWPSVLLADEIPNVIGLAKGWSSSSSSLWNRLKRKVFRRCAIIEAYEILRFILRRLVVDRTDEQKLIKAFLDIVDDAAASAGRQGAIGSDFVHDFKLKNLAMLHQAVCKLTAFLLTRPHGDDQMKLVLLLQDLHECFMRDILRATVTDKLRAKLPFLVSRTTPLFLAAVRLPDQNDDHFFAQVNRLHSILSMNNAMASVPANLEARRRVTFFCNSMFMKMPEAPPVQRMRSFAVMTPYYHESVMYSKKELQQLNEDGISTIYYLQNIFPDDWQNLQERLGCNGKALWEVGGGEEVCRWASYRGQTLARTVRGMMYYHRALKLLALLDEELQVTKLESFDSVPSSSSAADQTLRELRSKALADVKFSYVVTCQIYGKQRQSKAPEAKRISELLRENSALRVAFVDEVKGEEGGPPEFFSVLIKWDEVLQQEVEIFRVKLPGPIVIGEGKPENQNHAIIFTRGEALQTIDMNQDSYLEEALKVRNFLREFDSKGLEQRPRTILGMREHVFTGSVSSLASFMSAQETAFVTLGQRVLANPLKVRMHYGHPDVFDRLWFIQRGGISKASKVINISEDIFAGFSATLRAGSSTHHEYIQVGKGRDVGLNQIALFEAKVSSGNGEQVLSRDVFRLGHGLDIVRMLSFYNTSVGFFFSTTLTALAVYAFLWGRCYLALSGIEGEIVKDPIQNDALTATINQQFLVQLGIFTALPLLAELILEKGMGAALWEFILMQLQLASVFFTFSLGTRSHYFTRTVMHGGAKYRSTGRGFVVRHESFAFNYRFYARSHFVKSIEIILLLVVYLCYSDALSGSSYWLLAFSSWFLALSWMLAPFLFNPSGFDWLKAVDDFEEWRNWLVTPGGSGLKENESWEVWWGEERGHLKSTGIWGLLTEFVLALRFFFFQFAITYQLNVTGGSTSILWYGLSWAVILLLVGLFVSLSLVSSKLSIKHHLIFRAVGLTVTFVFLALLITTFILTNFAFWDILALALAILPTGWGLLQIAILLPPLFPSIEKGLGWKLVTRVARSYEFAFGVIVFIPVAFLSWLPGLQDMQTRVLFNQAFSRGLQITRLVVGKSPNVGY